MAASAMCRPWLPVPDTHRERSVATQEKQPGSVLNAVRAFLQWRKAQPALVTGSIAFLDAPEPVLAFVREHDGQRMLVAFNLSADAVAWQPPGTSMPIGVLDVPGIAPAVLNGGVLEFPAHGAVYAELA